MHECLKVSEVGQIECQTCEKKIYVVKKILGKIFLKFFSLNLILLYNLNYFYHFQPFLYYKKCVRLKEVIRQDFDQCGADSLAENTLNAPEFVCQSSRVLDFNEKRFDRVSVVRALVSKM